MVEQFVGTWKMTVSENFDDFMKALGLNDTQRQKVNKVKPKFSLSVDKHGTITMETLSIFKALEIQFKLNEPFEEPTADDRKATLSTMITVGNGKLIQKHIYDDGELYVERENSDGKMIVIHDGECDGIEDLQYEK